MKLESGAFLYIEDWLGYEPFNALNLATLFLVRSAN
jgi:hypothetical protein